MQSRTSRGCARYLRVLARVLLQAPLYGDCAHGAKGDYVHALEAEDFALFADGKPVAFDLDFSFVPISLVVVAENCGDCGAAIKKVRKVGVMLLPLITGERGEAALVTYSDTARVVQRFERGGTGITEAMASIRPSGN